MTSVVVCDLSTKLEFVSPLWHACAGAAQHWPAAVHTSGPARLWNTGSPRTDSDLCQHSAGTHFPLKVCLNASKTIYNLCSRLCIVLFS